MQPPEEDTEESWPAGQVLVWTQRPSGEVPVEGAVMQESAGTGDWTQVLRPGQSQFSRDPGARGRRILGK